MDPTLAYKSELCSGIIIPYIKSKLIQSFLDYPDTFGEWF